MTQLRAVAIRKAFGSTTVLDGVTVEAGTGEFIVLVGPSGCGKSTLLRILAGLESVTAGQVLLDGRDVTDEPPRSRGMAMVFQDYALYPNMTVFENMAFALRLQGRPADEIRKRVGDIAHMLNLEEYLSRHPRQLSGGQRQRVAMGRAMVRNPSVFLFDEPLSNLDAKLRIRMRGEIRTLQQQLGVTSVYVTHDQVEAMTMADRIVVMKDGRIEQTGSPAELYGTPATLFAASFIGSPSMNFLQTRREGAAAALAIEHAHGTSLSVPELPADAPGSITVGIRPEDVELTGDSQAELRGQVVLIENTGPDAYAYVDTAAGRICSSIPPTAGWRRGDDVSIRLRPGSLHLFDPRSSRRIPVPQSHGLRA